MVGKIKEGKSFGGCVAYNLNREKATVLYAEGVRSVNSSTITQDFNMQRKMNPKLKNAVGHIILSWSPNDKDKINSDIMMKDAKTYLEKLDIRNTQMLIVEHADRSHPHLHVIYNRVNNEGRTISNNNLWRRNIQVTQSITRENGYYFAPGKQDVNRGRLKGKDKVKLEIFDAVKSALKTADSWKTLRAKLKFMGISMQYKFAKGSLGVQGVSFSKNGIILKGSQVDRSLSYAKIDQVLTSKAKQQDVFPGFDEIKEPASESSVIASPGIETEKTLATEGSSVGMEVMASLLTGFGNIAPDEDDERNKRRLRKLNR
jgi:hypothetical protein